MSIFSEWPANPKTGLIQKKTEHVLRFLVIIYLRRHTLLHPGPPVKIKIISDVCNGHHYFPLTFLFTPLKKFCQHPFVSISKNYSSFRTK